MQVPCPAAAMGLPDAMRTECSQKEEENSSSCSLGPPAIHIDHLGEILLVPHNSGK